MRTHLCVPKVCTNVGVLGVVFFLDDFHEVLDCDTLVVVDFDDVMGSMHDPKPHRLRPQPLVRVQVVIENECRR